jgi:hypothetical protein
MRYLQLGSVVATCASVALVVACAGGAGDANSPLSAPGAVNRVYTTATQVGQAGDHVANEGEVEVCKVGTDATFNVSVDGGQATQFSIADGTCKVVVLDNSTNNTSKSVTVTEVSSPSYTFQSVDKSVIQFQTGTQIDVGPTTTTGLADGQSVPVNAFHGGLLLYHNAPVVQGHCTYTLGWYKNHTSSWPSGNLHPNDTFDGIKIIDLLNTPPKGSQYIILAHQYITALLNIQGGSSVPPAVQTALDTAAAYFAGGGNGAGDPSVDITGVAAILDDYNNGISGPGHCNS